MSDTRIIDWEVVGNRTPYTAPEAMTAHLQGNVYNHPDPKVSNGEFVTTSRMVDSSGLTVTTASGTKYILGTINKAYLKYIKDSGLKYDPSNPIKMKDAK
tara:strand:- start:855 stop:1154 length:300 start_codon:yes stop_codon:yes gene_type:complete